MKDLYVDNCEITKKEFVRLQHHLFNYGFRWQKMGLYTYKTRFSGCSIGLDMRLKKIYVTSLSTSEKLISREKFFNLDLSKLLSN